MQKKNKQNSFFGFLFCINIIDAKALQCSNGIFCFVHIDISLLLAVERLTELCWWVNLRIRMQQKCFECTTLSNRRTDRRGRMVRHLAYRTYVFVNVFFCLCAHVCVYLFTCIGGRRSDELNFISSTRHNSVDGLKWNFHFIGEIIYFRV